MWWLLLACARPAECPPAPDCPEPVAAERAEPAAGACLEPWEAELLAPVVEELRAGVRAEWWGLCRGQRRCDEPLGPEPGRLDPGDYVLAARLDAPRVGAGWAVRLEVSCESRSPAGRVVRKDHRHTYEVPAGARGYRLDPLWRARAPRAEGERRCEARLVPLRPDGAEGDPLVARWVEPVAG